MNAEKANQLTLQSLNQLITEKEKFWLIINKYIFSEIEKKALNGERILVIDLEKINSKSVLLNNTDFEFIKYKLQTEGYDIEIIYEFFSTIVKKFIIKW